MAESDQAKHDATADGTVTDSGAPRPVFNDAEIGFKEFGNYEILGEIARGGVGVIYRAKQKGLERIVALKVLQGGAMVSGDQIKRFLQEAQSAAKLQHPYIVPIHDFGVQDGQHYFTMDLIEGRSLADRLSEGPLPTREALEIARQVADALHYAHEHGVIHRDIKPGNILLDTAGRVKVTDFGLAKELNQDQMQLTVTGQVMGTPRYMSPEQASGKTAEADQRSDVFSLGVTLYEMLTGQPTFEAANVMEMLQKVCTFDPAAPNKINPKVHRDASTICMKAIEKDPGRRFQTALDMTQDIERFQAGEPIEAKAVGVVGQTFRKVKRYSMIIAVNVSFISLAIYLLVFYLNSRPSFLELHVANQDADMALDGAEILPDQLGTALKIKAGKHHILVAHEPEYDPQEVDFETDPAESRVLTIGLIRRQGVVVVNSDPPDAAITLLSADGLRIPLRGPRIEQELPTGLYAVLVHRENYLARDVELVVADRVTNTYQVTLQPVAVWSVPANANVQSVPIVADLDGDGATEVVIGDDGGSVRCLQSRSGVTKWVRLVDDPVQAPLAVADINRDGKPEVFVGTTGKQLYCLDGIDGHPVWKEPANAGGAIIGAILLHDINGDGLPDAMVGSGSGYVSAVNGADGTPIWATLIGGRIESAFAWTRVGTNDVILVGSSNKTLAMLDPRTGVPIWKIDLATPLLFPPRFDVSNGQPVALLSTPKHPGDVRTMTAVSLADHKILGESDRYPFRVDLFGDGKLENIILTEAGTECFAPDGTNELWHTEYLAVGTYTADMNGDGVLDLVFNNGPDDIVAINGQNGQLLGHIKLDSSTGRGFTLDDTDRNGLPDILAGVGQRIYCFSLSGGRKRWSARSDGYFDAPFVPVGDQFITKNSAGEIECHDPSHAEPVWHVSTSPQPEPYAGVAAGEGIVIDADAQARRISAYAAATGKQLWNMRLPTQSPIIGTPAVGEGLTIVSDGVAGVYAFTLTNGVTRWSAALPNVTTAAAISTDAVYLVSQTGATNLLYSLTLADGKYRWKAPVAFPDPIPTPPALVDLNGDGVADVVAFCDNGYIYALDGRDGHQLWAPFQHSDARTRTRNGIAVTGTDGIFANYRGDVTCLDLKTGKSKWTYRSKEPVYGVPALADMNDDGLPDILIGTMKGRVQCISGKGDIRLWGHDVGSPIRYANPLPLKTARTNKSFVLVGTGPPENGLYCLSGDSLRANARPWSGPWKQVMATK